MKAYFGNEQSKINLLTIIESWLGTPYMHMAYEKGMGADCTKFIGACLVDAGILKCLEPNEYYPKDWQIHGKDEIVVNSIYRHAKYLNEGFSFGVVSFDNPLFGDVILFSTCGSGLANHAGIYLGNETLAHCIQRLGVHKTQLNQFWRKKIKKVYRIFEVENGY